MSTEANAALAWPIDATEAAYLGDRLVERKKTTAAVREVWIRDVDAPRTATALALCGTEVPGGISFTYEPEVEGQYGRWGELYRDAGYFGDPRNSEPTIRTEDIGNPEVDRYWPDIPRPFVGDPRMDPTVLEEGCMLPWLSPGVFWGGTSAEWADWARAELDKLMTPAEVDRSRQMQTATVFQDALAFANDQMQRALSGVGPITGDKPAWMDPNEPEDYESSVRYVCGEIPGLDGVIFEDGTMVDAEQAEKAEPPAGPAPG